MTEPKSSANTFVEIHRASDVVDAHIVKAALAAAGISSHVEGENVAATEPNLCWANPRVVVESADAPKAAKVLDELQENRGKYPATAPLADSGHRPTVRRQRPVTIDSGFFNSRQHRTALFILGTLVLGLLFKFLHLH
jgi:hypothetical protein